MKKKKEPKGGVKQAKTTKNERNRNKTSQIKPNENLIGAKNIQNELKKPQKNLKLGKTNQNELKQPKNDLKPAKTTQNKTKKQKNK